MSSTTTRPADGPLSPRRLSIPTDDDAITRRTKSLAAAVPIADLERTKSMWDGDHWDRYDLTSLAFAVIDQVALHMGISAGMTHDDALAYAASQAARQDPVGGSQLHEQAAARVLSHLIGVEPFTCSYVAHTGDGPVRRTHTFRILYEQWNAAGDPYLRTTEEAINVLVGGLDVDIESAQSAIEAQLRTLIARGALDDAGRFAELARYRTIEYLEHVRTIVRDTLMDPDAHDWLEEVPTELRSALEHVAERIRVETELRSAVADRRDAIVDPDARGRVNILLATLGDCMARNSELQTHLIGARQALRDAQDVRFTRRGASQSRLNLHADLMLALMSAPPVAAAAATSRVWGYVAGVRQPFWLHWSSLLEALLEVPDVDDPGHQVEEPDFADIDGPAWWEPYWDAADALVGAAAAPVTLSQLLARIDAMSVDGVDLDPSGVAAAVCHVAYSLRDTPLLDDDRQPYPVLLAVPTGRPLDSRWAAGDDLRLVRAVVDTTPAAGGASVHEQGDWVEVLG